MFQKLIIAIFVSNKIAIAISLINKIIIQEVRSFHFTIDICRKLT